MSLICKVKKNFGSFCLNVDIETGNEVQALLGASGCGKSITLRCIAGIVKPDEGQIILNDTILFDSARKINLPPQKRKVGFLFQDYALFPNMTVWKNIMMGIHMSNHHCREENIVALLEAFHLKELAERYPHQLSGGQKQRCALARIMAGQPEILLLDEPFSALDSHLKWHLEQELSAMIERFSKPVLFVSHNRDEVYRNCDKITIMNGGRTDLARDKREMFQNPVTYTAALLTGCKNISPVKTKENHIFSEEWGLRFVSDTELCDIKFMGIRAKQILPAYKAKGENVSIRFFYDIVHETEEAFGYILMVRPSGTPHTPIRWEINKRDREEMKNRPQELCILKSQVLLLQ